MGYTNRDRRLVKVTSREVRRVRRLRRRAEKRELDGQHPRKQADRARRRGWWFA